MAQKKKAPKKAPAGKVPAQPAPAPSRTPAVATAPRRPGNGFNAQPAPGGAPPGTPQAARGAALATPGDAPLIDPATGQPVAPPAPAPMVPMEDPDDKTSLIENPPPGVENAPKLRFAEGFTQRGSHGLNVVGDLVYEDINRELDGLQGFKKYRELAENSAVAGACLMAIETLIRKAPWTVRPGDKSEEEKYRAQAIESMLHDMSSSWADIITEILTMMVYGFSYLEIVYKIRRGPEEKNRKYRSQYEDGLIGWGKWISIPQETLDGWEWDDEGGIQAMKQRAPNDHGKVRVIPIDKALLFRTKTTKNNPQGRSLLRSAYFPWKWVKRVMEYEGVGIERDLAGLPYAGVPPEILSSTASQADQEQLAYVKKVVQQVRQNELGGVVWPMAYDEGGKPLWEFKLLATGGMKQFDTGKVIERYERRIAMSMLADFVMMGHERGGGVTLSKDKVTLIGRVLASLLSSIADVINRHAITKLYALNGWKSVAKCELVPGDVENQDIKNLGVYVRNLMSVGALTPDPTLERALRDFAGLPPQDLSSLGPTDVDPLDPNLDDQPDDEELDEDGNPIPDPALDEEPVEPGAPEESSQPDAEERRRQRGSNARATRGKDTSRPAKPKSPYPGIPRHLRPGVVPRKKSAGQAQ